MQTPRQLASLLVLAALAGCGDEAAKPESAPASKPAASAPAKPAPAKPAPAKPANSPVDQAKQAAAATQGQLDQTAKDAAAALTDLKVPTQEEADAAASQQINEQNADEEFAKLQKELEADKP